MPQQAKISLRQELRDATLHCLLTDNKYIPLGVIRDKITIERVREKLPAPSWLTRIFYPCRDYDLENRIQSARKVVAVLVLIDKCEFVVPLLAEGLTDSDLPLHKDGPAVRSSCGKRTFGSFRAFDDHKELAEMFHEEQGAVLAPDLEFESDNVIEIELEAQCALPFTNCEEIATTQFSRVYTAELHPSHCRARKASGPTQVAIKKLSRQDSESFRKEKENLNHVRSIKSDHLIGHIAVCEAAKCIVFPWASGGNLQHFWETHGQGKLPRTAAVYRWFLEQLTGLAHAMSELHAKNFRHGDLKPANILRFSDCAGAGLGTLKIADVGVSKMHGEATNLRSRPTRTTASTETYQAPEACKEWGAGGPRSRRYDSWSMGCIILEFVVWLLYDVAALESFRDARGYAYYRIKAAGAREGAGDAHEVHPKVCEAVRRLEADGRCRGTALGALVRLVEEHVLKIVPEERLKTAQLHEKLEGILKDAGEATYLFNAADPPSPVPEIFCRPPRKPSELKSTHEQG